ncbi:MAG: ribbon-helix-helix protein, CopG family [Nocardioides sp.]|nr:ribbon-helix-helix protein, CopG family [Nocardioides sp.]
MRTTVTIDDELLARAKVRAAETRTSLGSVLEDALRAHLDEQVAPSAPAVLPVFRPTTPGLLPGVDLDDSDALARLLEDEAPHAAP